MAIDRRIDVRSFREMRDALRAIDREAPKELRKGLREAAKIVSDATRPKVARRSGKAANSVKPRASSDGASISVGGAGREYYPFLDFGGSTGPGHRPGVTNSGAVKRPFTKEGRYLYPTIAEKGDEVKRHIDDLMAGLARRYDIPTSGGE